MAALTLARYGFEPYYPDLARWLIYFQTVDETVGEVEATLDDILS